MRHYSTRPRTIRATSHHDAPPIAEPYTQGERNEIHAAVLEFIRAGRVETFNPSATGDGLTKTVEAMDNYQRDLLELTALDVLGTIDHTPMPSRLKQGTPLKIVRV